jgi:hypothetical protein
VGSYALGLLSNPIRIAAIVSIWRNCAAQCRSIAKDKERAECDKAVARANLRNFKPKPATPTRQSFRDRYTLA